MRGFAKSLRSQAKIMARMKRQQYASLALRLITSLLANPQALHAHVAAQLARAAGIQATTNILSISLL